MPMAWLVRDTKVLASVEVADTFRTRLFGLLGLPLGHVLDASRLVQGACAPDDKRGEHE